MIEELLNKLGVERNSLSSIEIETLRNWASALQQNKLSPEDVKNYIGSMITSIERELAGYETPSNITALLFRNKRRIHLEARLYNYIMLRDFLTAPERAKAFVESQVRNLSKQVSKNS